MLTPSQYDHLCDQLIDLYAQLDESIIEDMTRRMLRMGRVSESTRWQAQQLQESGLLYEDILSDIARRTNATSQHVRGLFEDAGVESIRNDNRYYQAAGLEGIVRMSDRALQMLNAGYVKCQGDLKNLTLTTAVTAQQAYIQACNLAYMQVTSGMMDYNTAIRRAVQNAAKDGSFVLYPSGHRDRLDVAVRRSVLTGVGQTVRQLSLINAGDMDCDVMELTAHAGARPSHAQWQGQLVSLSGRRGYLSTSDIGYGSVDGFGGANCRHDWHPFFENFSNRAYSEERLKELNEAHIKIGDKLYTDYEVSQMQRALERKIREKKRQVVAAKTFVSEAKSDAEAKAAQEDFQKASVKLKKAEQNLKDFLNQTGFLPDNARTWVNGFGRSQAQKAVWTNKKASHPLTSSIRSGTMKTRKDATSEEANKIQWPSKGKWLTKEQFRELRDYATSKGVALTGFKTSDADIQLIKEELDSIAKIVEMFPELMGNKRKPLTVSLNEYMDSNDFAMTSRREPNIIQLNADAFRNSERLKEEYDKLVKEHWFVQGTDYKSIIKHELGHLYQAVHKIKDDEIIQMAMKISGINDKNKLFQFLLENLSEYSQAATNGSEIISEVFSDFFSNESPTEFSQNFIKELLKKQQEDSKEGEEKNDSR